MPDPVEMYRQKAPSTPAKITLTVLQLSVVLTVAWLLFGGGISVVSERLHLVPTMGSTLRRALLLSASVIYFLRLMIYTFVFMKRRMSWGEVSVITVVVGGAHLGLAFLGGRQALPVGWVEGLGVLLYVVGSYLNSGAEYQRHRWKQQSTNQGQFYAEGLFRYAMHINYFGDVVLFTGWVLLTARWVLFAIPLIMLLGFVRMHIPTLDRYLAERYGQVFHAYRARTKKLAPFFY